MTQNTTARLLTVKLPVAINEHGAWNCRAWNSGEGQNEDHCKLASESYFTGEEKVHIVMVEAQVPVPEGVELPPNKDSCEVEILG